MQCAFPESVSAMSARAVQEIHSMPDEYPLIWSWGSVWCLESGVVNVCTGWWIAPSPSQLMKLPVPYKAVAHFKWTEKINLHHEGSENWNTSLLLKALWLHHIYELCCSHDWLTGWFLVYLMTLFNCVGYKVVNGRMTVKDEEVVMVCLKILYPHFIWNDWGKP